jgi:hypothetical protein
VSFWSFFNFRQALRDLIEDEIALQILKREWDGFSLAATHGSHSITFHPRGHGKWQTA